MEGFSRNDEIERMKTSIEKAPGSKMPMLPTAFLFESRGRISGFFVKEGRKILGIVKK